MAININGNSNIKSVHYNGTDLSSVTFNDVVVWRKGSTLDKISDLYISETGYTNVKLKYTLPTNATGVKIYYNTSPNVSSSNYLGFSDSNTTNTCDVSGLSVNTTYYFAAYAYNSLTVSDASNIVNHKTLSVDENAINDWEYKLDESKNKIVLIKYIGKAVDTLTIHPFYYLNEKNYKTYINERSFCADYTSVGAFHSPPNSGNVSKIRKIVFESNVFVDGQSLYSLFSIGNGGEGLLSLEEIDISGLDVNNVTDVRAMFICPNLKTIKGLSVFRNNHLINNYTLMFSCPSLKFLDVSDLNTENASDLCGMFQHTSIETLDLRNFDTRKATRMDYMFCNSPKLKRIYVSDKWVTSQAKTDYMFYNCGTDTVTYIE